MHEYSKRGESWPNADPTKSGRRSGLLSRQEGTFPDFRLITLEAVRAPRFFWSLLLHLRKAELNFALLLKMFSLSAYISGAEI